jgi:hypothetical protein
MCVFRLVLLSIIVLIAFSSALLLLHQFFFLAGRQPSNHRISSCCKAAISRGITGQVGVLFTENALRVRTPSCGKDSEPRKFTRSFRR